MAANLVIGRFAGLLQGDEAGLATVFGVDRVGLRVGGDVGAVREDEFGLESDGRDGYHLRG